MASSAAFRIGACLTNLTYIINLTYLTNLTYLNFQIRFCQLHPGSRHSSLLLLPLLHRPPIHPLHRQYVSPNPDPSPTSDGYSSKVYVCFYVCLKCLVPLFLFLLSLFFVSLFPCLFFHPLHRKHVSLHSDTTRIQVSYSVIISLFVCLSVYLFVRWSVSLSVLSSTAPETCFS